MQAFRIFAVARLMGQGAVLNEPAFSVHNDVSSQYVPAHECRNVKFLFRQSHVERCPPHQRRRRGPRSLRALMRREVLRFTPPVRAHGESGAAPSGAFAGDQKFDFP